MRTSRIAATVAAGAAAVALLGAAPASAAPAGGQVTQGGGDRMASYHHSTFNTKFECQYQAWIASTRGLGVECRPDLKSDGSADWELWIVDEWKYW